MSKNLKGSIMLLIAAVLWGTTFVAQSAGMNYVEPFTYNASRMFIGSAALVPVILIFSKTGFVNLTRGRVKASVWGGIWCGVILFAASSLQQVAMLSTTAGKAGFITSLYIILVPLLKLFILRKRTSLNILFYAAMAVAGFYLLCVSDGFIIAGSDFLMLLCAVMFAGHIIAVDYFIGKNTDGVVISCVQFFVSGILALAAALVFEHPQLNSIMDAKLTILYAGILSSGVAYTLQILGQKHTEPTSATMIMSLESVFAAVSGWLVLGERLSLKEGIGCILVFAAVVLAQIRTKKSD